MRKCVLVISSGTIILALRCTFMPNKCIFVCWMRSNISESVSKITCPSLSIKIFGDNETHGAHLDVILLVIHRQI